MSKFIIGKKLEMTQKFRPDGTVVPVTKVWSEPCVVVQVKTQAKDGYSAVQLGSGSSKRQAKPQVGHLKGLQSKTLKEFRIEQAEEATFAVGDSILLSSFVPGDVVKVTGVSKGRGFQGVVKRWKFRGSPASHGHKDQERMPGTSGAGGVQHVRKGKKMPGRMGGDQITVTNLEVIEVDEKNNAIFIKGAVPGARNGEVWIVGKGNVNIGKKSAPASAPADASVETKSAEPAVKTPA